MAQIEEMYANALNGQVRMYYTFEDTNNRIMGARAVNDSNYYCAIRLEYRGDLFVDKIGPNTNRTYDISSRWRNADLDEVTLSMEFSYTAF